MKQCESISDPDSIVADGIQRHDFRLAVQILSQSRKAKETKETKFVNLIIHLITVFYDNNLMQ